MLFSVVATPFCISTNSAQGAQGFQFLHILANICFLFCFAFLRARILMGVLGYILYEFYSKISRGDSKIFAIKRG